ncbi:histamine H3 receptor-like [Glandiceps talaboti]
MPFEMRNISVLMNTSNEADGDITTLETPGRNYGPIENITVGIVLVVIICVTIFMNALIILAFCTSKEVRKLNNYFFFSLAITDILMGMFVMPFMLTEQLLGSWPYGKVVCQFWLCMDYFLSSASVFNMAVICIDRYMHILHPLTYPSKRTPKLVITMILIAWILGLLAETPATLLWETISGTSVINYSHTCEVEWFDNVPFQIASTVITILIPFIVMLVLYCRMYVAVQKSMRWIRKHSLAASPSPSLLDLQRFNVKTTETNHDVRQDYHSDASGDEHHSQTGRNWNTARQTLQKTGSMRSNLNLNLFFKSRTTKRTRILKDKNTATTLGILLGFFALSWLPWQIISIIDSACASYCVPVIWYDIFLWLQYSNSMVNPFLYIYRDTSFRQAVKNIMKCCMPLTQRSVSSTTPV